MSKYSKSKKNYKAIALGSSVAAVTGFLTGLLTAPKSGKQTRHDIKETANKSRYEAEKDLKKLHTELNELIEQARKSGVKVSSKTEKELQELIEKAQDTKEKAREVLSAIHEGDAEDDDLKRAINNASSALEHLKDYLKK